MHKIFCLCKTLNIDNRVVYNPSYTLDTSTYTAMHYTVGNTAVVICGAPKDYMYHSGGIPATGLCEQTSVCSNIQRGVCKQSKMESQLIEEINVMCNLLSFKELLSLTHIPTTRKMALLVKDLSTFKMT